MADQSTAEPALGLATVGEVASVLRVTPNTVYRLVERGKISVVRVGGAIRIRLVDVLAALESKPSAAASSEGEPKHRRSHRKMAAISGSISPRVATVSALETSRRIRQAVKKAARFGSE